MLILIFGSKSGLGDDFGQFDTKTHCFMSLFGQMPLRNVVTMETAKAQDDQTIELCVIC